ncbi:hypothetical protein ACVW1C_004891 [Bradyrhizobium sp. USDA 4011]
MIGCFVYYAAPERTAHVLNILSLPGQEVGVLCAMFRHLERTGHKNIENNPMHSRGWGHSSSTHIR